MPLVDFSVDNGATQVLPASHTLRANAAKLSGLRHLLCEGATVATPRVGSVLVYDARLYHRGMGNVTTDGRPALVFRYDLAETPPPGVGMLGAIWQAIVATTLHLVSSATMTEQVRP